MFNSTNVLWITGQTLSFLSLFDPLYSVSGEFVKKKTEGNSKLKIKKLMNSDPIQKNGRQKYSATL